MFDHLSEQVSWEQHLSLAQRHSHCYWQRHWQWLALLSLGCANAEGLLRGPLRCAAGLQAGAARAAGRRARTASAPTTVVACACPVRHSPRRMRRATSRQQRVRSTRTRGARLGTPRGPPATRPSRFAPSTSPHRPPRRRRRSRRRTRSASTAERTSSAPARASRGSPPRTRPPRRVAAAPRALRASQCGALACRTRAGWTAASFRSRATRSPLPRTRSMAAAAFATHYTSIV